MNMDDKKLTATLNAIGKECFVTYFEYFIDSSRSNEEIASIIRKDRNYTQNASRSRTSKARSIIKHNRIVDALQVIIESGRVDDLCKGKAEKLLNGMTSQNSARLARKNGFNEPDKYPITRTSRQVPSGSPSKKITNERAISKTCPYPNLSNTVGRELTIILGRICHHIHPDIVDYIKESNLSYKSQFESICHPSCNVESFFYDNSDCVFPGFRRPINREKNGKWKNNVLDADGTILNDNTFPRHIWAYLSVNKAYSGGSTGMWASSGLANFELAHIFGHKQDERELESRTFESFTNEPEPYGLFTSASNIVLIPKGFAKPTDHMESTRVSFFKRHLDLYGNNIIGIKNLDESLVPSWYSEIKWIDPILPVDWKEKMDNLLEYRESYLRRKYANFNGG